MGTNSPQDSMHTCLHTCQFSIANPPGRFLGGRTALENPEEFHMNLTRTCLKTPNETPFEFRIKPRMLLNMPYAFQMCNMNVCEDGWINE